MDWWRWRGLEFMTMISEVIELSHAEQRGWLKHPVALPEWMWCRHAKLSPGEDDVRCWLPVLPGVSRSRVSLRGSLRVFRWIVVFRNEFRHFRAPSPWPGPTSHHVSPVWTVPGEAPAGDRISSSLCINLSYTHLMILIPRSEHFLALSWVRAAVFHVLSSFHRCLSGKVVSGQFFFGSNSTLLCRYASSSSSFPLKAVILGQVKCCRWARTMFSWDSHGKDFLWLLGRFSVKLDEFWWVLAQDFQLNFIKPIEVADASFSPGSAAGGTTLPWGRETASMQAGTDDRLSSPCSVYMCLWEINK